MFNPNLIGVSFRWNVAKETDKRVPALFFHRKKMPVSASAMSQMIDWVLYGAEGDPNCCADQDLESPSTFEVNFFCFSCLFFLGH